MPFPILIHGEIEYRELYIWLRDKYLGDLAKLAEDSEEHLTFLWEPLDGSQGSFAYVTRRREKEIAEREGMPVSLVGNYICENREEGRRLMKSYGYKAKFTKVAKKIFPQMSGAMMQLFAEYVQVKYKMLNLSLSFPHDIYDGYLGDNYAEGGGTLQGSCMRQEQCQDYMHVYAKNKVQLAALLDDDERVQARALVWRAEPVIPVTGRRQGHMPERVWFIDRVYTTRDGQVKLMHSRLYKALKAIEDLPVYARSRQNYERLEAMELPSCEFADIGFKYTLSLGHEDLEKCPYLDTMWRYVQYDSATERPALYSSNVSGICEDASLRDTDGRWGELTPHTIYSEYEDMDIDEEYAVYSEFHRSYIHCDDAIHTCDGEIVHRQDALELHDGTWAHENATVELYNGSFAHENDSQLVEIDGEYFLSDDISYDYNGEPVHPANEDDYYACTYGEARHEMVHKDEVHLFYDRHGQLHVCLTDEGEQMENAIIEKQDRQQMLLENAS